ncbi:MAG: endonuclease [Erysipelotrichaceae bacterium]|jgi:endonuclease I|nr:endonuclease [Erysipelotrichaceae bacterium]
MNKKITLPISILTLLTLGLGACQNNDSSSSTIISSSSDETSSSSSTSDDRPEYALDIYGDYYANCLTWTNGADLKAKLSTAMHNGFVGQKYDGVWTTNQAADQALDNLDMVNQLYSEDDILKTKTKGSGDQTGWDREHAFAKTLIVGQNPSTSSVGPLTDFHNLFAGWTTANNSRSNKNFGNVSEPTGEVGNNIYTETVFEPGSVEDKAKVARAIFYMATMYATDYELFLRNETCGTGEKCHGNLPDLLEWNLAPVSRGEYQHNLAVLNYQFNRNPYIDYPELADYVYGNKQNESGELKYLVPSSLLLDAKATTLSNYAIKDGTYSFLEGDTFSKTDSLKVVEVKKDYTIGNEITDFDLIGISDGEELTGVGSKDIKVKIGEQEIKYPITITVDPVGAMEYHHKIVKDDFSTTPGVTNTITLNGVEWSELRANEKATTRTTNNAKGLQLGSSTNSVQSFTLTSKETFSYNEKTSFNKIAYEGSVAAGESATLVFKVDGTQVGESITMGPNTSGYNTYIVNLDEPKSGIITVEITGIKKALYFYRIGVGLI